MMRQFNQNCKNKEFCDMFVRNIDWPGPCREKIGIRLEVKTIPVIRYVNLSDSNTTTSDVAQLDFVGVPKGRKLEFETDNPNDGDDSDGDSSSNNTTTNACGPEDKNCTTTVSTIIEYKQAYEYVISDKSSSFFLYAVVECSNENVELLSPFEGKTIKRKNLGFYAVFTDLLLMTMFLFALWFITYFIKVDSERHRNLLFETSEFSVIVNNLPELNEDYTIEQMKAELWDHITTIIKQQP